MPRPLSHNGLIILKVKQSDYRTTFTGLLWERTRKGFRYGWVCHKFREIFGGWPRPLRRYEAAEPDAVLREYLGIMSKRYAAKKRRADARAQQLKADGLLPSFMTAEDWEVKL
jgi:hypothetical protein